MYATTQSCNNLKENQELVHNNSGNIEPMRKGTASFSLYLLGNLCLPIRQFPKRLLPLLLPPMMPNTHQTRPHSHHARQKRQHIRSIITFPPHITFSRSIFANNTVGIKDNAVKQVEDVARDNRCNGNTSPIRRQSMNTKRLSNDRWEDAEEETIAQTTERRDEDEIVRRCDGDCEELGDGEDHGCNCETPRAAGVEVLDQEIGTDAR